MPGREGGEQGNGVLAVPRGGLEQRDVAAHREADHELLEPWIARPAGLQHGRHVLAASRMVGAPGQARSASRAAVVDRPDAVPEAAEHLRAAHHVVRIRVAAEPVEEQHARIARALTLEDLVRLHLDEDVKVARRATPHPRLAFADRHCLDAAHASALPAARPATSPPTDRMTDAIR